MPIMLRRERGARWRDLVATAVLATGAVLAGAGCSSQHAAAPGSVNSCFQFGVAAIQHHVTATALPPACQGLSQLEVNVALDRALQAAAAGDRPGDDPPPVSHAPALVMAAHITAAVVTILLATLAATGSG